MFEIMIMIMNTRIQQQKHRLNDGKQKSTCKKHTTTKHFEEGQVNQTTTRNKRENNARERM